MSFRPDIHRQIELGGSKYRITEHPSAPGIPYGQEGRQAVVYQLVSGTDVKALKVFKTRFRLPVMVTLADRMAPFSRLSGLQVCQRTVLSASRHGDLLRRYPELMYAVLMPWIDGPTWMEVLFGRQALTSDQGLRLAQSLLTTLISMEERGLAHCDLAGPNVLLPALVESECKSSSSIELVDVEGLFGPGLSRPQVLTRGSKGYAHRTSAEGLWSAEADRFAGAILLAEILGWCDERVREAAWDESYFNPGDGEFDLGEMQQACERKRLLADVLCELWGNGVAVLFERAWSSETLADCASFGEWAVALPAETDSSNRDIGVSVDATGEAVRVLMQSAERLLQDGNREAALTVYQQALRLISPESDLGLELSQLITEVEKPGDAAKPTRVQAAEIDEGDDIPHLPKVKWNHQVPYLSRPVLILMSLTAFIGLGLALYVGVRLFGDLVRAAAIQAGLMGGPVAEMVVASTFLATVIGCLEAWVFRKRMARNHRWRFILLTAVAGIAGGLLGGFVVKSGTVSWAAGGALAGGLAGYLKSVGQNRMMHSEEVRGWWLLWNTITWAGVWCFGYWLADSSVAIHATAGGVAVIIILSGVALAVFLQLWPAVEF